MIPTRLIFSSTRTDSDFETVDDILQASRTNNVRDGVTGVLVVGGRQFVQLLEGDRASVSQCFVRIARDPRHQDIRVISAGEAPHRLFGEYGMQRIDLSNIKPNLLSRYLVYGTFQPSLMRQAGIEQFCRDLSAGNWQAAHYEEPEQDCELLERLRQLHQAARHVLDDNVGTRKLGRDRLERLQASLLRQANEARALQDRLARIGADEAQRLELAGLIEYFDTVLVTVTRQLNG